MGVVLLLLVVAAIFGGVGLLVEGLMWLLLAALVLVAVGAVLAAHDLPWPALRGRG